MINLQLGSNDTLELTLKAKKPNQRIMAPREARVMLCPGILTGTFLPASFTTNLPLRGPKKKDAVAAATPPTMWTAPPPAKS